MSRDATCTENEMEAERRAPGHMPTGILGFDEIAHGGLPRGGLTVVLGGAGTGKTIFGLQVLASGAREGREPGIVVAFEESAARLLANTEGFAWGGRAFARSAIHVLDAQLPQSIEQSGEFDLVGLLAVVSLEARQVGAKRVVFDGLDALLGFLGEPALIRREVFRLRDWIHASGLTAIVTAKGDSAEARPMGEYDFLQFMADCVVTMHHRIVDGTALRYVRVAKYRGSAHSANEIPLAITPAGLEVAQSTGLERVHPVSNERVSTGIVRLDAMLAGGYHRGSSVLITGVPGTAKTSISAAFAGAACLRGERTVYVSFDEAPQQIVRNVASIGLQFAPHIESGVLHLHSLRARNDSPEVHVARIRGLLRDSGAQNLVIDPLSALTQRGCEGEAEAAVLQLLDFVKSAGLTIVSTSLIGNAAPLAEHTPHKVSTIADTWMHVSYENRSGERNRALTIVKARGTAHSNQVRELVLSETGITLADVYALGGELLMGTLRWEKEQDEERRRAGALISTALRERKVELAISATKAHVDTLVREQAIQEAELRQIRAEAATDQRHLAGENDELLLRRQADRSTEDGPLSHPPTP